MKTNPVYKRENMVSSRSLRLSTILLIFNGILALVALLNMYSTLAQVRMTAEIQYTSFLDLYLFVAVLEFIMLIFIMPALTAGSISGERERQTLELMLTTKMRPVDIVLGKLEASLSTMAVLIISSFPIIAMVFVYGGITLRDLAYLLLCFFAAALFVGSLGICCSAVFSKTTIATVVTYGIVGIIVAGTYGINQFAYYLNTMRLDAYPAVAGQSEVALGSGGLLYLLLINPTTTFLVTISHLTGQEQVVTSVAHWFGQRQQSDFFFGWVPASIAIQLMLAVLMLWIAVRALSPQGVARKRKEKKQL